MKVILVHILQQILSVRIKVCIHFQTYFNKYLSGHKVIKQKVVLSNIFILTYIWMFNLWVE
jgi:hypothetical protein